MDTPALFCAIGSETSNLTEQVVHNQLSSFLDILGDRDDVLLLPPDFTRFHSQAGMVTRILCDLYSARTQQHDSGSPSATRRQLSPNITILPALGTHAPMTEDEIRKMFGDRLADMKDPSPFVVHDWRNDVETIGTAPASMVATATNGMVEKPWPAQLNRLVWSKRKSQVPSGKRPPVVISIGQVVPHEVMGMANFNKNLLVGCGGVDAINLSHFIGMY